MILRLENTTTHQEYQYEVVDVNNGEKLYFRFNINTLDLNDGEYTLKLYEGDELVLSDILKIGDFNSNALQYSKGDNTYIEVKFDAKIQEKEVEISKIDTIVKPDEDFDGMSSVFIDAQPLYDAAYIEGYNEGREDGEAASFDIGFESGVNMQKAKLETISITENGVYEREDGYNSITVEVPDLNGDYQTGYDTGYVDGEYSGFNNGYTAGIEFATENAEEIVAQTARVLDITENGTYTSKYSEPINPDVMPEGNLIKTVNVNVIPKINVAENGIKLAYSRFKYVPDWLDWKGITSLKYMFAYCSSLITIPLIDTSNVTDISYCFINDVVLQSIPPLNTSKVTTIYNMFSNCIKLESVPPLDVSNVGTGYNAQLFGYQSMNSLTDFGGLIGLKSNLTSYGFEKCPNLSYESCINILNGLYDFTGNGETPTSQQGQLKVHSNFLSLVGDEVSIGTNKGWTITV